MKDSERRARLEEEFQDYLERIKAQEFPMIDVNDPRVQPILDAREAGDEEAESAATRGMSLWMNNFWAVFNQMRTRRLNPDAANLRLTYLDKALKLGEVWDRFVGDNQELLAELDEQLGRYKPSFGLASFQFGIALTLGYGGTREQALEKLNALREATGHPLGTDAIYYAATDVINPLLKRAWAAMEQASIDPNGFVR